MKIIARAMAAIAIAFCASGAYARNATSTLLTISGKAVPGKNVTLSATLSGGPFLVMAPNGGGGGTINFYDGSTVIGKVQINPATAQNVYWYYEDTYVLNTDGSVSVVTTRFLLSQLTTVSMSYVLPNSVGQRTFTATFTVDDKFSTGSTSAPAIVNAKYPSISSVINLILD